MKSLKFRVSELVGAEVALGEGRTGFFVLRPASPRALLEACCAPQILRAPCLWGQQKMVSFHFFLFYLFIYLFIYF